MLRSAMGSCLPSLWREACHRRALVVASERARRAGRPARSPPALAALTHRARRPRSPLPALAKTKTWSRSEKSQPEPFSML